MNFVKEDFAYYRRSFELMYRSYFRRRMIALGVAILIILGYLFLLKESLLLNIILLGILLGMMAWLVSLSQKASEVVRAFEEENQVPQIHQLTEFEDHYAFPMNDGTTMRVKKNGNRNFPSNNKQYTLMAGYKKVFFVQQPLMIFYYDLLEMKYDEAYRLKRNRQNGFNRWSRYFSFRSFKGSIGNVFQFLLGNIFFLFIAYRLIRYLIDILLHIL